MSDIPRKRGDRAQKTAEKRARRERRQLARDEKVREEHAQLVVERSHDLRFTQRIHRHDGTSRSRTTYATTPVPRWSNFGIKECDEALECRLLSIR